MRVKRQKGGRRIEIVITRTHIFFTYLGISHRPSKSKKDSWTRHESNMRLYAGHLVSKYARGRPRFQGRVRLLSI
jgi:hypothetical protein